MFYLMKKKSSLGQERASVLLSDDAMRSCAWFFSLQTILIITLFFSCQTHQEESLSLTTVVSMSFLGPIFIF
jgi:hypothetical protein